MVKLTNELILQSAFYTNALHERELDLRGQRIPEIENLGATRDAFDCIDLSGNDITALTNFPRLPRLTTLLLSGNRVATIAADNITASLPSLESLQLANNRVCLLFCFFSFLVLLFHHTRTHMHMLTNTQIADFGEVEHLAGLKCLEHLWLAGNPIASASDYRLRVVRLLPSVRFLDGARVTKHERDAAQALS